MNTLTIKTCNKQYIYIYIFGPQYYEKIRKLLNKHKIILSDEFKYLNEVD